MSGLTFHANDEQETDLFGAALAHVLPPGAVVALKGTLGAGKTRLVQAVAKAVGIDPAEVLSPTFVLVHEYEVRGQGTWDRGQGLQEPAATRLPQPVSVIYHIDAYRIRDDDEFRELGPEEYYDSNGWTFIEWADRVADCLPREYLEVDIDPTGPTAREFAVRVHGQSLNVVAASLKASLERVER
jgi:tRNA threonylcarbamoyladenosine biosynthesis protein TsaE